MFLASKNAILIINYLFSHHHQIKPKYMFFHSTSKEHVVKNYEYKTMTLTQTLLSF